MEYMLMNCVHCGAGTYAEHARKCENHPANQPGAKERMDDLVMEMARTLTTSFSVEIGVDYAGWYAKVRAETDAEHGAREPEEKRFIADEGLTKREIAADLVASFAFEGEDENKELTSDEQGALEDFLAGRMTDKEAQMYVERVRSAEENVLGDDWSTDTYYDALGEIDELLTNHLLDCSGRTTES